MAQPTLPSFPDPRANDFYRHPTEEDLAWRLDDHPDWFNSTSFITVCKDGGLLFISTLLANLKPMYTHQPGVHVKYVPPPPATGKNVHFSQKFDTKSLVLSPGNTSFSIGGIVVTRDVPTNSYKIILGDKDCPIKGELTFAANGQTGIKYGEDGKVAFAADRSEYEQLFFTIPRAEAKGAITVEGKPVAIDGYGFVSHYRQNMKAHKVALRWQLIKFHSDSVTLNQNLLVTPRTWNMQRVSNGMFVHEGKLRAVTMDNDIRYPTTKYDDDTGYDAPTAAEFMWKGKTLDGEAFEAKISLQPTRLIDKMDILGHLPWAIRMILKAFVARPWHYQWADQCTAQIKIGNESFEVKGTALHEVTFVNPE
jgi:hypothetical protein